MSIINQKKKVFGNIAAARSLVEGLPNLQLNSSFPSINNGTDPIVFLTDLIKALIGYDALKDFVVDFLTYSFDEIETKIKEALKTELKSIVICGVNPTVPNFIKSTGSGITIEVKKLDFFEIFKTDANSENGKLIYNDVTNPLTNSSDLNTFLQGVIQNEGTTFSWKNILDLQFNSQGNANQPNNTLNIKLNNSYDNKSLNVFINDFIDSLSLFNSEIIINNLLDLVFGTISKSISKTKKQLDQEGKISMLIDKLTQDDSCNDDGYFSFSNEEISFIEKRSYQKQNGFIKIKTSEDVASSIKKETLVDMNESLFIATNKQDRKDILSKSIDLLSDESANNVLNNTDKISVKLNFIQLLINDLIKAIVNVILAPKIIIIFLIIYKIVTNNNEFIDPVDFIKQNQNLIKEIIKFITQIIIEKLLTIAIKHISELVEQTMVKKKIEKNKNKIAQKLSLIGVSQEAIRIIKGLS